MAFIVMKNAMGTFHALSKHARSSPHSSTVILQRMSCAMSTGHFQSSDDLSACENALEFGRCPHGGGCFHKSAAVDPNARIDIGAVVHSKAFLGANVHVGSGAVIGPSVSIGESTKIGYNAALTNCSVGMSCIIHSGVCIGQDGFGFFMDHEGCVTKKPQKIRISGRPFPYFFSVIKYGEKTYDFFKSGHGQVPLDTFDSSRSLQNICSALKSFPLSFFPMLYVRIGNDVEIGANTCIDRGSWRDTTIGDHTKIDNLVQIGHNVVIGKGCILCGQVGIAGSVTIGDYVTMGGRVAVKDHVSIVSKVRLAGNTCVTKDITSTGDYAGFPAVPADEWRRQLIKLQRFYREEAHKR